MKATAALLIVAAACQLGHADVSHNSNLNVLDRLASRSIGDKFKEAIENLKKLMREGDAAAGIPVLDPLDLKSYEFETSNKLFSLKGEVMNLFLEGLSNYVVQNADFKFAGKKVTVDILWSGVAGKTQYSVPSGLVLDKFPVYGSGDVSFKASEFNFATQANIKMDTKADRLSVLSFSNTTISLGNLEVDITGLLDDDELSALVSGVITDNFADMLRDFNGDVVAIVTETLLEVINDTLKDKSLKEILKKLR